MNSLTVSEARAHLSDVIDAVIDQNECVILTRGGKAVAAIIPIEDAEFLQAWEDKIDLADAELALAEAREFGTIPWETVKAEFGLS